MHDPNWLAQAQQVLAAFNTVPGAAAAFQAAAAAQQPGAGTAAAIAQAHAQAESAKAVREWGAAMAAATASASAPTAPAAPAAGGANWTAQWASMMDPNYGGQAKAVEQWSPGAAPTGVLTPAQRAAGIVPGKGWEGKGAGKSSGSNQTADAIICAISTSMEGTTAEDLESAENGTWTLDELKKRLSQYFRKAAKSVTFGGGFEKVINEYADASLGNITWALQGTKFLAKADFTLVLEVAIDELFPADFKTQIPEGSALQETILAAHDRALEEARFTPFWQDTVKAAVEGKKAQNKVFNFGEEKRREVVTKIFAAPEAEFFYAADNGVYEKTQEFAREWIIAILKALGDWPEGVMELPNAVRLFETMFHKEEVTLPRAIVRYLEEPLPYPWEYVGEIVKGHYAEQAAKNKAAEGPGGKKRKHDEGPNWQYKTVMCTNWTNEGKCKMGEWCVFAHDESELWAHQTQLVAAQSAGIVGPDGLPTKGKAKGSKDPWGGKGGEDPWGGKGGKDPWGLKGGKDPWGGKDGGKDPWGLKGGKDPWGGKGGKGMELMWEMPWDKGAGKDPWGFEGWDDGKGFKGKGMPFKGKGGGKYGKDDSWKGGKGKKGGEEDWGVDEWGGLA